MTREQIDVALPLEVLALPVTESAILDSGSTVDPKVDRKIDDEAGQQLRKAQDSPLTLEAQTSNNDDALASFLTSLKWMSQSQASKAQSIGGPRPRRSLGSLECHYSPNVKLARRTSTICRTASSLTPGTQFTSPFRKTSSMTNEPQSYRGTMSTESGDRCYIDLPALAGDRLDELPYSIRVLLEAAARKCDGSSITSEDIENILNWARGKAGQVEIPFAPGRVILQDFTGVSGGR